jgi:hypothetical protein
MSSVRSALGGVAAAFATLCAVACSDMASFLGDTLGTDLGCDGRYGDGKRVSACREIEDTLAPGKFRAVCKKQKAEASAGGCPREHRIGGCRIRKENPDGSEMTDWFYEADTLEDAGVKIAAADTPAVEKLCADKRRYKGGADFVSP